MCIANAITIIVAIKIHFREFSRKRAGFCTGSVMNLLERSYAEMGFDVPEDFDSLQLS